MNVVQRFEDKVVTCPASGCWIWNASDNGSYGCFFLHGRLTSAHRASYRIYKGEIPKGMSVLHRCDLPVCVNPSHLFLGTQKENIYDAIFKERAPQIEVGPSCRNGHLRTEENIYLFRGKRMCRECRKNNLRKAYSKRKS